MGLYTLPTFFCPFPSQVNPHLQAAQERTLEWMRRFHLLRKEAAERRFLGGKLTLFAACTYPTAPWEKLALVSDFFAWMTMLDDQFDEADPLATQALVQEIVSELQGVLTQADPARTSFSSQKPLVRAFLDLWAQLAPPMASSWRQRFSGHVVAYLEAQSWEMQQRAHSRMVDSKTYTAKRLDAVGALQCFDLIEYCEHLSLPSQVFAAQEMQTLIQAAHKAITWANDIFSLEKELARGDRNNLVGIVQQEEHLSLQQAVERVNTMATAEVQRFLETKQHLPSFSPHIDQQVQTYMVGLQSWMRGHLDWSCQSQRFSVVEMTAYSYLENILTEQIS